MALKLKEDFTSHLLEINLINNQGLMRKMKIEQVKASFESEFSPVLEKFVVYDITLDQVKNFTADFIWRPGVYVFWNESEGVIKVGRHLTNSFKRALEHIRDNTGCMQELDGDPDTHLLLFNVKLEKDRYWVSALEIFFELELKPKISSGRLG